MKELVKRLQCSDDSIGKVQETVDLDTRANEALVARTYLDRIASEYPNAMMVMVQVTLQARIVVDADAPKEAHNV